MQACSNVKSQRTKEILNSSLLPLVKRASLKKGNFCLEVTPGTIESMPSEVAPTVVSQSHLRESLQAYQEEKFKTNEQSILSKLKGTFSTGTPLLPLPSSNTASKGSSKWSLFGTPEPPSWFEHFGLTVTQVKKPLLLSYSGRDG